jgi:hypothetical protein
VAGIGQPRTTRRIRIFGTNGGLEGKIDDSRVVIHKPHAAAGQSIDIAEMRNQVFD